MENDTITLRGILITEPETTIVNGLATIGKACIIVGAGYVIFKLGEKSKERKLEKERENLIKDYKTIRKIMKLMKHNEDWASNGSFFYAIFTPPIMKTITK